MSRKRLRPFLDEVISDADLRSSAERVASGAAAGEPTPASAPDPEGASPPGSGFPPPPWERPPALTLATSGDRTVPDATGWTGGPRRPANPPSAIAALPGIADPTSLTVEPPFGTEPGPSLAAVDTGLIGEPAAPVSAALATPEPPPASPMAPPAPSLVVTTPVPERLESPPELASAVDANPRARTESPTTILDGVVPTGATEAPVNSRRRRRSASLLPPLPAPADFPEDLADRVAIFAIPAPALAAPEVAAASSGGQAAATPHREPAPITTVGGDAPLAGWLPVLALGVALVVIFVIGVLVTR